MPPLFIAHRITKAYGIRSQNRIRMSLTSNSRKVGENEFTTARKPKGIPSDKPGRPVELSGGERLGAETGLPSEAAATGTGLLATGASTGGSIMNHWNRAVSNANT